MLSSNLLPAKIDFDSEKHTQIKIPYPLFPAPSQAQLHVFTHTTSAFPILSSSEGKGIVVSGQLLSAAPSLSHLSPAPAWSSLGAAVLQVKHTPA